MSISTTHHLQFSQYLGLVPHITRGSLFSQSSFILFLRWGGGLPVSALQNAIEKPSSPTWTNQSAKWYNNTMDGYSGGWWEWVWMGGMVQFFFGSTMALWGIHNEICLYLGETKYFIASHSKVQVQVQNVFITKICWFSLQCNCLTLQIRALWMIAWHCFFCAVTNCHNNTKNLGQKSSHVLSRDHMGRFLVCVRCLVALELKGYLSDWGILLCLLYENSIKLPSKGYSSLNGLRHLLMLAANHSLHVFGVGFQLYGQPK